MSAGPDIDCVGPFCDRAEGGAHNGEANNESRRSVADAIVNAAQGAIQRLFRDARQRAWATVRIGLRDETLRVGSGRFQSYLRQRFYAASATTARSDALKQAAAHFETQALFGDDVDQARIRVADHDGAMLLDLADKQGRCVEITAHGWRVLETAPVPFHRPSGMLPLPLPERGGDLRELAALLNLRDRETGEPAQALMLLCGWMVAALRARGPYPLLVLRGPPGSAKTTAAEIIRSIIDPAKPSTRNLSDSARDLFIATDAVHILAVDNLSGISPRMSDALCRLATGGGYATRALYTDGEETVFDAQRPVILNGIGVFVTRGDLQDRTLSLELVEIAPHERRRKADVDADIDAARPRLLGALLDAAVIGLRRQPDVVLGRLPRMADFTAWVVACEPAFAEEGEFMAAWQAAANSALPDDIAADPFVAAAIEMLSNMPRDQDGARIWEGASADLAARLNPEGKRRDLPRSANAARSALERASPLLARAGVRVTRLPRGSRKRSLRLTLTEGPSPPSPASHAPQSQGFPDDGPGDAPG